MRPGAATVSRVRLHAGQCEWNKRLSGIRNPESVTPVSRSNAGLSAVRSPQSTVLFARSPQRSYIPVVTDTRIARREPGEMLLLL